MMNALYLYVYHQESTSDNLPYGIPLNTLAIEVFLEWMKDSSDLDDIGVQYALAHRIFEYDVDETYWIMDDDPMNHRNVR